MLHLILGGCGTGKSTQLMQRLGDAVNAGRRTALLIPEQFSFAGEKKLYEQLGAQSFNRVETYSFMTLSLQILSQAGSARASGYASEQEKLLYLWQAAHQCAEQKLLESFERRIDSTEFILTLSDLVTKIRKAGVSAEMLLETAANLPDRLARKTGDLGQILLQYDRILSEHGRNDSLVNLTEAARIAQNGDFFRDCEFFIDEFDSFTGDQLQMLAVMTASCPEVWCAIRADKPGERPSGIFLGGNKTAAALTRLSNDAGKGVETEFLSAYRRSERPDLALVSTQVLRRRTRTLPAAPDIQLVTAADPAAEVEFICARICELLESDPNLHCRDIAVTVKDGSVYNDLLKRALERYELPYDSTEARSVLHTDLTRHMLTLLELLCAPALRTDTVLRYVKSPFSGYSAELSSMLEHFCFTYSIDREDWEKPFTSGEEAAADRTANFGGERLERLRAKLVGELQALRNACRGQTVRVICGELYNHLAKKKKAYESTFSDMKETARSEFVMVWNLLCDILDTLVTGFGGERLRMRRIYEQFLLLVQSSTFSVPPQTLDSIHIADAQTARLDAPKVVFVPGAVDGEFPGDVKVSGLFTESELCDLESHEIAISRLLPELHSDEMLIVAKLLSAPSQTLCLTAPKVGLDGGELLPSPVFDEIRAMFPGVDGLTLDADTLPVTYFVRTLAAGYYTYIRRMHEDSGEIAALHELLLSDPTYAARIRRLDVQKEVPFVPANLMHELLGDQIILSPSGIEQFHQCSFSYFCRYVLGLYIPERLEFSAQNIGNFSHFCLEQILRETPMQDLLALDSQELSALISGYADRYEAANFPDALRRSGRFRINYRSAHRTLLDLLLHMQSLFRQEHFRPMGYEVQFEPDPKNGEFPPLSLENGHILCKGKIDRVDVCQEPGTNLLRVIDYKTGDKSLTPENIRYGLDMQMLIYLFALDQHGAYEGAAPSGVLYLPSGQLKTKDYQQRDDKKAQSREEILDAHFLARGLLTETAAALGDPRALEKAVPVMQTSKYRQKSKLFTVTDEQMGHLKNFVEDTICQMARSLENGEIAPIPANINGNNPCHYCTFAALCQSRCTDDSRALTEAEKYAARALVFEGKEVVSDAELDDPTA